MGWNWNFSYIYRLPGLLTTSCFFVLYFTVSVTPSIITPECSNYFISLIVSFISSFEINKVPSRQVLIPRTFPGRPPPTSPGRPRKTLFDHPRDVLIWRPEDVPIWHLLYVLNWRPVDVLIWRSRDVPERLIWDVPMTFSGHSLEDLESTQIWMSQKIFEVFFQNLFDSPNLSKSISTLKVY